MRKTSFVPACDSLEGRTLLSHVGYHVVHHHETIIVRHEPIHKIKDQIAYPISAGVYRPQSQPLYAPGGPSPLDVRQGGVGDCWLISSLAEVAARDPQDITSMITQLSPTTYSVRLYNPAGVAQSFVVDNTLPTPVTGGAPIYDQPIGALWPALVEKAYVEAASMGWVVNSITQAAKPCSDTYLDVNGGDPGWALNAVTGLAYNEVTTASDPNWSAADIATTLSTPGSLVVMGTMFGMGEDNGYVLDHAYAALGWTPGNYGGKFTLMNPWNVSQGLNSMYLWGGKYEVYGSEFTSTPSYVNSEFYSIDWIV
jgi:hypothetical protein